MVPIVIIAGIITLSVSLLGTLLFIEALKMEY